MRTISQDARQLIAFINALSISSDVAEWSDAFCKGLYRMLGDVEDVSFRVIFTAKLYTLSKSEPEFLIDMWKRPGDHDTRPNFALSHNKEGEPAYEQIIVTHRNNNPQLDENFILHGFDYHYSNGTYIGSIVLWQGRHRRAISKHTMDLMRELEPFFVFALSDIITRYHYFQPAGTTFGKVVEQIVREAELTHKEHEVLVLHMYGLSYGEIGEKLGISIPAVKKRILQIHRKVNVRNHAELFARYFSALVPTPRRPDTHHTAHSKVYPR